MTQFWTLEDFTNEMDHLQKLSSIRPDSPCVAAMCQTFCAKLAAVTTWTSEAIVKLLEAAEKLTCQDALKLEIVKTIENVLQPRKPHEIAKLWPDCRIFVPIFDPRGLDHAFG